MLLPIPEVIYACFTLLCLLITLIALPTARIIGDKPLSASLLVASGVLLCLSITTWSGNTEWELPRPFTLGVFPVTFRADALSSIFLALMAVIGVAISLFSPGYLSHLQSRIHAGQYWSALFLFLFSMATVILSADAITFVVAWELMSLSSLALVASEHKQHSVQEASFIYLGATRIATALIAGGFLWMHALTNTWNFAEWRFAVPSHHYAALLIFLGFCIKAGIWPFHIWLPYAHPAAPSPVSALMSGVMIKIAIYGMVRILVCGDLNCTWLAMAALVMGAVSAFWGVLFALVQHDLKRLLAYSSVENVGLILMGIAVVFLCKASQQPTEIAALALIAALFHCINHGIFKSLLFLGAGAIDARTHTRSLEQLGGLARRMPWTMLCFLTGSAAICALPPTNGFASKWFLYQSLLQVCWDSRSLLERGFCLASIGVLAIVGGLAVACFVKAIGVSFLGNPRSAPANHAQEGDWAMVASQLLLASLSLILGLCVPTMLGVLSPACQSATAHMAAGDLFPIPMTTMAAALAALAATIYIAFLRSSNTRRYITWECGFGDLSPRTQVAAESFAQPIARIFSPLLRYKLNTEIAGKDRKHFPEHIKVEPHMVSLLEATLYRPAVRLVNYSARALAKIQSGSIHLYLLYICVTLIILLLAGTQL